MLHGVCPYPFGVVGSFVSLRAGDESPGAVRGTKVGFISVTYGTCPIPTHPEPPRATRSHPEPPGATRSYRITDDVPRVTDDCPA